MNGGVLGSSEDQSSQSPETSPEMPLQLEEPVTLFGHWICPFSVRVEFALVQLGIDYEIVDVPPTAAPEGLRCSRRVYFELSALRSR